MKRKKRNAGRKADKSAGHSQTDTGQPKPRALGAQVSGSGCSCGALFDYRSEIDAHLREANQAQLFAPMKVLCAWHRRNFGAELVMREGTEPASHGICDECLERRTIGLQMELLLTKGVEQHCREMRKEVRVLLSQDLSDLGS